MMDTAKSSSHAGTSEHKERLKTAINLLIRDQEGKFDECLVERFFGFLADGEPNIGAIALKIILEIYDDAKFATLNQSRLFRFQRAYYEYYLPMEISITRSSECLWSRLPQVISKNDPPEIKAVLSLLISIVNGRSSFSWIIHKQFQEPIQSGRIKDIVSLARYFLTTGTNYHIQNLACSLMADLIKQSSKRHTSTSHLFTRSLKQNIEELLELGCQGVYYVINESLNNERLVPYIVEQLGLEEILKRSLDVAIKKQNHTDMNSIGKCLALAKIEEDLLVEKLLNVGHLGAIITYATNMHRDFFCHTWLLYFVVYPILTHCEGEEAEELVGRLIMARAEKQFVQRHMQDKYVIQCLQYLRRSLSIKERHIDDDMGRQPKRTFILLLDVLLEYIRCNYSKTEKDFKNLMESCIILKNVQERFTRKSETMWLYKLMDTLLELLEPLNDDISPNRKALVLEMIRLMSFSMRKITAFQSSNFVKKTHRYRVNIITLALKISHLDILEEIASLFNKCEFDFSTDPDSNQTYVDLVWNHMYKLAKEKHDRDLLASVAILLPTIDVKVNDEVLNHVGLVRFQTIPKLLGDILIDLAIDDKSVEMISKSISYCYPKLTPDMMRPLMIISYKSDLYSSYVSLMCKSSSDARIEHMARAICVAIKRDLYHTFHSLLLRSLCTIIDDYARPKVNTLELLVRTRILETLYYIHENPSYAKQTRMSVCENVRSLELFKTKPVNTIINLIKEDDPEDLSRQKRAGDIVDFYCGTRHGKCESLLTDTSLYRENKLDMNAYVDQILNQINSIAFDCY